VTAWTNHVGRLPVGLGTHLLLDQAAEVEAAHDLFQDVEAVIASKPIGVINARDALQVLLGDVEYDVSFFRDYITGIGYADRGRRIRHQVEG
jgi:hypothetical protein